MTTIAYTLKRSKRKTLGISILPDGTVRVSAPMRLSKTTIEAMVENKRAWIEDKQKEFAMQGGQTPIFSFQEGQPLFFLGQCYPLHICGETDRQKEFYFDGKGFLLFGPAMPYAKDLTVKWYKKQANDYLQQQVPVWAKRMGILYRCVKITSAKGRWGSCNSRGNLNFPWRLLFLPPELIEYIIVHELCHCIELNHSQHFWRLVEAALPDYTVRRAELRQWEKKLLCYRAAL